MPFGGNDWLASTQEPTLEPEIPICDPHHHFWGFRDQRIPYQRYLLHELIADIGSGHNVRSPVFIEARAMYRADRPEEMRPVGEIEFVQGLAAASASGIYGSHKAAAAIVGHANLNLGELVEPVLEALQTASPNHFRGIRHSVTWDPNPDVENTAAHQIEGQLSRDSFRSGAKVLARMGFSLEGWMYFHQLPDLAEFARAVPDLTIVLNHIGGLLRFGPYANRDDEVLATISLRLIDTGRTRLLLNVFQLDDDDPSGPILGDLTSITETPISITTTVSVCALDIDLRYRNGALTMQFELGTAEPAIWSIWLMASGQLIPLWSALASVVVPPVSFHASMTLPPLGKIWLLSALTTAEGAPCFTYDTGNTGTPTSSPPSIEELQELFPTPTTAPPNN